MAEAVEDFIKASEPLTRANTGQRSQLSAKYAYNRAIQLRRFAGTFPNTAVHFAAHANENLTAAQAGNSPAMIHAHYKGLATKAEGEKWFAVKRPKTASNVIPLPSAVRKS